MTARHRRPVEELIKTLKIACAKRPSNSSSKRPRSCATESRDFGRREFRGSAAGRERKAKSKSQKSKGKMQNAKVKVVRVWKFEAFHADSK